MLDMMRGSNENDEKFNGNPICLLEQHEPGQSMPGPHEDGWKRAQGDGARK